MELSEAVRLVGADEDIADGAAGDPAAHVRSVREDINHAELDYWAEVDSALPEHLLAAYRMVIDASDDDITAALAAMPTQQS